VIKKEDLLELKEELELAEENIDMGPCTFWACEGPDEPPVYMKTCSKCRGQQLVRQAIEKVKKLLEAIKPESETL